MSDLPREPDARYNELKQTFSPKAWGLLKGRQLTLKMHPTDAVRLSIDALLAEGFRPYPEDIAAKLALEGSAWTAAVVRIGTSKNWGHSFVSDVLADTPIGLLMKLRSKVGEMFVIATARELPGGLTELIVMPHTGGGDPDHDRGAQPQLDAGIARILEQLHSSGALVDEGDPLPFTKVRDTSCPAFIGKFRELLDLNWMGRPKRRK